MSPSSPSSAPKHILCIDDEAPILDLLKEYLSSQGYRVTTVSTAVEARRIVEADKPDLVISDLQLEETDGLHLIDLSPDEVAQCIADLRAAEAAAGRTQPLSVSLRKGILVRSEDRDDDKALYGTPAKIRRDLQTYADVGVDYLVSNLRQAKTIDALEEALDETARALLDG